MSKLTPILAATALASLVSCLYPEPVPPPHRPPYGPDYDISPPPPPSQPTQPTQPAPPAFSDSGVPQPPAPPTTPTPPPTANGNFPMATRTDNPDQVISPYEPYNVIDISNPRIAPGKLARDPSNGKIFRVPYN